MSSFTQTERVTLAGLGVIALVALGLLAWRREAPLAAFEDATTQPPAEHPEWDAALQAQRRVDLNTADAAALARLPNIGPSLAARIVAYREQHGQFLTREELLRVPGIGPATFKRLAEHITVE